MKVITRSEKLQLIGLLALAKNHVEALKGIQEAAQQLTGEDDDIGHTCDAVWSGDDASYSFDVLKKRLDIEVSK